MAMVEPRAGAGNAVSFFAPKLRQRSDSLRRKRKMSVEPKDWTAAHYTANEAECKRMLEDIECLRQIPCLNSSSLEDMEDGRLVRFRGMIQDMYDPEYYLGEYTVRDEETGELKKRCAKYADSAERLDWDEEDNGAISERQTCVVVSIPGLNEWAQEKGPRGAAGAATKASLVDQPMELEEPPRKRERKENSSLSREHILNFPIPNDDGKACIVKIYDEISYKLNEVVDIVGFVSLDPNLHAIQSGAEKDDPEILTHNPPASMVPRIHAIKMSVDCATRSSPVSSDVFSRAPSIRSDLRMVLGQLLFGDSLAADYLICHLVSAVYLRKDHLCLGTLPINITNFPVSKYKTFAKDLYRVIACLVPKSHFLELTLDHLNEANLVPKKDYECNRLTSGTLQLSKNTHLVIDETGLTSGRVSPAGKKNYEAITDVIQFQRVSYDFKYFTVEYETDIPVLILSEVKSFVPCTTQIALKIDQQSEDLYPRVLEATAQYLRDEARLSNFRDYLAALRHAEFEIGQDMSNVIQEDFVKLRQLRKNFGADNLHSLMVLARLMALSHGEHSLSLERWRETLDGELERIDRLPKLKT